MKMINAENPILRKKDGGPAKPAAAHRRKTAVFFLLAVLLLLSACTQKSEFKLMIATIWEVPDPVPGGNAYDFSSSSRVIQLERRGFLRGMEDYPADIDITEFVLPEKADMTENTRGLAELYSDKDILLTVGASRDDSTMHTAMASNFFNIPMLIPFSDGDLVTENGAEEVMRMTPVSRKYANYIGQKIFPANTFQTINSILFENGPMPEYHISIGVFFAENFNGHETSVMITQQLMDNGMNIEYYRPFEKGALLPVFNRCWTEPGSSLADMDVLIIIAEDNDDLPNLSNVLEYWKNRSHKPIVLTVGYEPGSEDPNIFSADNLYVIQQAIDLSRCPADIVEHEEAMGYAAGYLTKHVFDIVSADPPKEPSVWRQWLTNDIQKMQDHLDYVESYRAKVFSALMTLDEEVPCFGRVHFVSGSADISELELNHFTAPGRHETVDPSLIQQLLLERVREKTSR